jgi:sensor histidine kinase YesM
MNTGSHQGLATLSHAVYYVDRLMGTQSLSLDVWRKRSESILPFFFLWIVLTVVGSTSTAPGGFERGWLEGLQRSAISWMVWALLVPVLIAVDRLLPVSRDALFMRFVFHIPLSFVFTAIKRLLNTVVVSIILHAEPERSHRLLETLRFSLKGQFQSTFLNYWIVILIYYAISYQRYIKGRELQRLELERQISESRLEALRTQLRPSFLFNALRSISVSLEHSPRVARQKLGELGDLLRMGVAHSEEQEVPLAQEIGFLEHYVEIQQTTPNSFRLSIRPDPDVLHALVPTFILQPLVETAILTEKVSDSADRQVEVRAWRTEERLHLQVEACESRPPNGEDLGISVLNLQERLKRLYGEVNQRFGIVKVPGQGLRVDVSIPFREG